MMMQKNYNEKPPIGGFFCAQLTKNPYYSIMAQIHKIKKNGTTVLPLTVTDAVLFPSGVSLGDVLTLDDNGDLHVMARGIYADGFVSAGGVGGGGEAGAGISLQEVWQSLSSNDDAFAGIKINSAHVPNMASVFGYIWAAGHANSVGGYDLNAIVANGIYQLNSSANWKNNPLSSTYGVMMFAQGAGDCFAQMAVSYEQGSKMYVRSGNIRNGAMNLARRWQEVAFMANVVDLTTGQTIAGAKKFENEITTIARGAGANIVGQSVEDESTGNVYAIWGYDKNSADIYIGARPGGYNDGDIYITADAGYVCVDKLRIGNATLVYDEDADALVCDLPIITR